MAGARVTVLPTALLLFGDDWIHLLRTVRRTSQKVELNNLRFFCNKNNNTTFRGCSCWWLMNWNWSRCEGATSFISARSVHTDCSERHCFKIRLRRGCINPGISNTVQISFDSTYLSKFLWHETLALLGAQSTLVWQSRQLWHHTNGVNGFFSDCLTQTWKMASCQNNGAWCRYGLTK